MNSSYVSESKTLAKNSSTKFLPWVPAKGPTGRRNVITGILIHADVTQLDVATAVVQGEDLYKLFSRVHVKDIGGTRWDLTGEASRHMAALLMPPSSFHEHADVAIATDTSAEAGLYIPFSKPFARRSHDFAIPADVFESLELTQPGDATLDIGSSAVTLDAITWSVVAFTREEDSIEFKMRDVVKSTAMETLTEGKVSIQGGYLCELGAYASGASGGAAMANWTAHRIDEVQPTELQDFVMKMRYSSERGGAPNGDGTIGEEVTSHPVRANTLRVLHLPPNDAKLADHPFVTGSALVRATNSVASVLFIYRYIAPKSAVLGRKVAKSHGVTGNLRAKTAGKSRQNLRQWGARARFIGVTGKPNA